MLSLKKLFSISKKSRNFLFEEVHSDSCFSYGANKTFIDYYKYLSPVSTAINLIIDTFTTIEPIIYNDKLQQFESDHEVLKLLKKPNPNYNYNSFFTLFLLNYFLTGNSYISVTFGNRGQVLRLDILNPDSFSITEDNSGGIDSYIYRNNNYKIEYKRDLIKNIYISSNGTQLIHFKNINPNCNQNLLGFSLLSSCQVKIEQYKELNLHNVNFIKKGGRPSMYIKYDQDKYVGSTDELSNYKQKLKEQIKGSYNAGSIIISDASFEIIELSSNMRDMDYKELERSTIIAIANNFKIPLPMVLAEQMTMANMEQSKYYFYDNTIIPLFSKVMKFLSNNILSLYKNAEYETITYDPSTIEALNNRKSKESLELSKSGVLTINEIRTKLGYEAIEGGDDIYKPFNNSIIGTDINTEDNRKKPSKKEFMNKLLSVKDINGNPYYKADEIAEAVKTFNNED